MNSFLQGTNGIMGILAGILNTAADFNPIYQVGAVVTGQDAAGNCLSKGERGLTLLGMAIGPLVKALPKLNKVAQEALNFAKKQSKISGYMQKGAAAKKALDAFRKGESVDLFVKDRRAAEDILFSVFRQEGIMNSSTGIADSELGMYKISEPHYHWDEAIVGGRIAHHKESDWHGYIPHLQIHGHNGRVIRIFFGDPIY